MLLVAIAIKLDSKGPVFFKQKRHGFNNELIEVYKFRSLYTDMTDHSVQKSVTKDDPRVTRVGRFIRKTSIDELPQLFNVVLKGNLSLVGPRPHAVNQKVENRQFDEAVDGYFARHRVKPGITGWAQINGWRGETDIAREDQAARRARPLLHRELVAAARPLHPGEDAAGAAEVRERLLMIARARAELRACGAAGAPRRAAHLRRAAALRHAVAHRRLRRDRVHRAEPLRGDVVSHAWRCSSSAG